MRGTRRGSLRAGANAAMAEATADALIDAEAQGLPSHGLSRITQYATHLRNGPRRRERGSGIVRGRGGAILVDARCGLAYPACAFAVARIVERAREFGIAFAGVRNPHHFGMAAHHLGPLARAGMVGLALGNSPAAMPAARRRTPLFGTNPIAAVFPRRDGEPIVIDLSLSEAARGKVMVAAKQGKPIPLGWALDRDGNPPPMRRPRSKARCCRWAAPWARQGRDAGARRRAARLRAHRCRMGLRPTSSSSTRAIVLASARRSSRSIRTRSPARRCYDERIETLIAAMLADDGVRLPGVRRASIAREAAVRGH